MSAFVHLQAAVQASKAEYESSKEELRMRLTVLPMASDRLNKIDMQLVGLEQQASALRVEIRRLASKALRPTKPSISVTRSQVLRRSVLSGDSGLDVTLLPGSLPVETAAAPPQRKCSKQGKRRSSCLTSQSFADCDTVGLPNGRVVELSTNSALLGPLECIVAEPMGKQLLPDAYVATGLVICIHGHPPTKDILEEWGEAVKQAHWLELGLSVAVPNLQMSSALTIEDLECVIEATLKLLDLGTCVIVGKAWGALKAVELAASERLAGKIEGIVLVAPSSPPPMACSACNAPVLVMWARNDEVEAFEESGAWMEALCIDERESPTTLHEVPSGGHHFSRILESHDAAQALQNFTAASILHAELLAREEGRPWSERANRLLAELPGFLRTLGMEQDHKDDPALQSFAHRRALFGQAEEEDTYSDEEEFRVAGSLTKSDIASRRLSNLLPQWIDSGMPTSSE